jgi:flagellar motor switch protein FliN/FliY
MTMDRTPEERAPHSRWLMEQWTAAMATAIQSMTEEQPEAQFSPRAEGEPGAAEPGALTWEQGFKDIPQPALWVAAPEKTWLELGKRTLRAAGIEAAEPGDARNTYLEILSQSLASVAQSLGGRLGREVACERGAERPEIGPAAERFSATLRFPDGELPLEVGLSAALLEAMEHPTGGDPAAASLESGAAAAGEAPSARSSSSSKTMDVLLDVELPVSVSFGRTQLPIKEVLKLTTGSIVELNRSLNEPVDVVVNNCVVARGEVVVVEGNYGVRIHHIVSRQDRLRSLR